jgi:hypothetical protein
VRPYHCSSDPARVYLSCRDYGPGDLQSAGMTSIKYPGFQLLRWAAKLSEKSKVILMLRSADGISAVDDGIDQCCHGLVPFDLNVRNTRILMRGGGIFENAHYLALGKDMCVV